MPLTVTANGVAVTLADGASLHDLIAELGVERRVAAVEHNGAPISTRTLASTMLSDGDRIELVRTVGGG